MERCAWAGTDPENVALPRRGVGPARHRRQPAVRKALPRGLPVGPQLADHPARSARSSASSSRISTSRKVAEDDRGRCRAAAAGRRHHPPPRQDRLDHQQRASGRSRSRRSSAASPPTSGASSPSRRGGPMLAARIQRETEASRALSKDLRKRGFSFVGPTTVLCLHAGHGAGQRPCRQLLLPRRMRSGAGGAEAAGVGAHAVGFLPCDSGGGGPCAAWGGGGPGASRAWPRPPPPPVSAVRLARKTGEEPRLRGGAAVTRGDPYWWSQ